MIDLDQFWTSGQSDADTVHVKLTDPFLFQPLPNQPFQLTTALDSAEMHNKPVVHEDRNTGAKSITVRLQGIDAPELHYQPQAPANLSAAVKAHQAAFHQQAKDYRQPYGETATVKLAEWLRNTYGQQSLPCVVTTQVDTPNEVFDIYGRFIGTIIIPDPHGNEPVPTEEPGERVLSPHHMPSHIPCSPRRWTGASIVARLLQTSGAACPVSVWLCV